MYDCYRYLHGNSIAETEKKDGAAIENKTVADRDVITCQVELHRVAVRSKKVAVS